MLKVICVLKGGGCYTNEYVNKLRNAVRRNYHQHFHFVCLTERHSNLKCCTVPFLSNSEGWWSKMEVFRIEGPCLYLDLDTVITGDLNPLVQSIMENDNKVTMLPAMNKKRMFGSYASGIMGWCGDWSWVFKEFMHTPEEYMSCTYDQVAMTNILGTDNIVTIDKEINKIYSYKKDCKEGLPEDASIVMFHGRPRPHDVKNDPWMKENWK